MAYRSGIGYDVHQLVSGRRFILGGVLIPSEKGLLGHSDADVLAHAVIDALLGAAALGDIGSHFPDTESDWKDADSLQLLARVREMLAENGYHIVNVDATVMLETPRLRPYIHAMREGLAGALKVDTGDVSVKATTTEKLGFTGRQEGVAALATCSIRRAQDHG